HIDNLGIERKLNEKNALIIIPEMAITKLATIVDCPRKFYLKNILKFEDERPSIREKEVLEDSKNFEELAVMKNSAKRGSEIHDEISRVILSDFSSNADNSTVQRTVEKLKNYRENYELV